LGEYKADARSFAFVKMGEFSHTNHHVLKQLQARFPHLEAKVVDLDRLPVIRRGDIPGLVFGVAREYGLAACASGERLRRHIGKTRYMFRRWREVLLQHLDSGNHAFTFQTQSLFDASCRGTPHFIYTDHTHLENLRYPAATAATPFSRGWAQLEKGAYQNARMVFTMSDNISRSLVEKYGCSPQRVECVYAGSNVSAASSENIDNARFSAKNILFVGVDWERKGGPVLLEAFRTVRRSHPDARLTIVGCSPHINEPGVHVEGRVPLGEVARYYRSATVFCLPTLNEPFGLVFLEAFSYGLPIVATDLGAIPEIVSDGKSGYLVTPRDVAELAERLRILLSDPARCAQFGSLGRKWVEHRYSWEATGQRLASHIERAARLAPRPKHEVARPAVAASPQLVTA
jgi:glycosyltransferase involved in cell wall biosynthesis